MCFWEAGGGERLSISDGELRRERWRRRSEKERSGRDKTMKRRFGGLEVWRFNENAHAAAFATTNPRRYRRVLQTSGYWCKVCGAPYVLSAPFEQSESGIPQSCTQRIKRGDQVLQGMSDGFGLGALPCVL